MCSGKHVAIQPVLTSSRARAPAGQLHAQGTASGTRYGRHDRDAKHDCHAKRNVNVQPIVAMTLDGGHACITPSHVFAHAHDPP